MLFNRSIQTILLLFAGIFLLACQNNDRSIVKEKNYQSVIKIACVGNSITYGYGITNRDSLSYPAQLQRLLGEKYQVKNFGISARTLMTSGDLPYVNETVYHDALAFDPDVVLIKLGTNDTKPHNWQHQQNFTKDYKKLVQSFQQLPARPIVVLLKAVPAFPERWGIRDSVIHFGLNPKIDSLANQLDLPLIDLYTPFVNHPELFPDFIHPNAEGAGIMAELLYIELTGKQIATSN